MRVTVRLFAAFREAAGRDLVELANLPEEATVRDVRALLNERFPALKPLEGAPVLDLEYVEEGTPVREGAELSFIPPVSGG